MSGRNVARATALVATVVMTSTLWAQAIPESQRQNSWFSAGQQHISTRHAEQTQQSEGARAKNVILFVGDGMGISTLSAARILDGQLRGKSGEESSLSFENFKHTALVKTYNVDAQIPDSSGTMTAIMSGIKTNVGVVGVDPSVLVDECSQEAGSELVTALELAEIKGLATGVVSTARITHATPAATYAKSANRSWEDISDQSAMAVLQGCVDIAVQLVSFEENLEKRFPGATVDGLDVVLGGGRRHFMPTAETADNFSLYGQGSGDRNDSRNLIAEWQQQYPSGRYVFDESGLDALDVSSSENVFGLFSSSHMQYEADRAANPGGQPSLSKMIRKSIEILDNDPDGFFLVVESGRIDHAHHAGNAYNALHETMELSRAVTVAQELTEGTDTLILVTADHSHVLTFSGYPKRGNPILGKVVSVGNSTAALAADGQPYTTLGYANGPGFRDYIDSIDPDRTYADSAVAGRQNLASVDTESPGFHQEALVPLVAETHGGEDVAIHATGPGAFRIQGTMEQNVIFHVMDKALGLTE